MAAAEDFSERPLQSWTFTEAALRRERQDAHRRALAAVEGLVDRRSGGRERLKPIELEQGCRLVLFYAQQIPELCGLCSAPSEVRWAAIMFFRRFFAVRSPMEFDPMPMMFAAVHLACKIEEVREITLDRILETTGFAADDGLRSKIAGFEAPLLQGLNFHLFMEPKPDSGLLALEKDLRQDLLQRNGGQKDGQCPEQDTRSSRGNHVATLVMEGTLRDDALQYAEEIVLQLSLRTDAVLRWPVSVLLTAALGTALDVLAARRTSISSCSGSSSSSSSSMNTAAHAASDACVKLLDASLEAQSQRQAFREVLEEVRHCIHKAEKPILQSTLQETAIAARRCHKAFDRLHVESYERHETRRRDRKRQFHQMRDDRRPPTPIKAAPFKAALLFPDEPVFTFDTVASASASAGRSADCGGFFINCRKDMFSSDSSKDMDY